MTQPVEDVKCPECDSDLTYAESWYGDNCSALVCCSPWCTYVWAL